MKILVIGPLTSGGRERRMAQLVVGLDDYPECDVLLLSPDGKVDYQEVKDSHATIIALTAEQRKDLKSSLDAIIGEFKPDIVHLWIEEIHWFRAIQRLRFKYHFKYIAGFVATGLAMPFFSRVHFSYMLGYWKADAVVSNSAAGLIARRAPKHNAHVIPNGFSFDRFDFSEDRDCKRQELGIGEALAVVMVARFESGKDWDLFLELAHRATIHHCNIRFIAVGYGSLFETYSAKANSLGLNNVVFLGRRSDVEQVLLACDVSVLFNNPPTAEGFSNSLMESMAAGVPVIATGTGGTPELVTHKVTGFLVKENDADTAFSYLMLLNDNQPLRIQMGKNAKKFVEQNLSLDLMTKRYVDLYESLCNPKKSKVK